MSAILKLLLVFFVLFPFFSNAQTLEIHYDLQTQKVKYVYNGDTIARPKVKRGDDILLLVKNYNNYLFEVDIKANKSEIVVPEMENTTLIKRISEQASPMKGSTPASNLPGQIFFDHSSAEERSSALFRPLEEIVFSASHTTGDMALVEKLNQIKTAYLSTRDKLKLSTGQMRSIQEDINQDLEASRINGIALLEIQKLKENPDLLPQDIKEISIGYLKTVFKVSDIEDVELKTVLERHDLKNVLSKKLLEFKKRQKEHLSLTQFMKSLNKQAFSIGIAHTDIESLQISIGDSYSNAQLTQQALFSIVPEYEKQIEKVQREDVQNLVTLWYEYKAIANNTFTKKYRTTADGDHISFDLYFIAKKDSAKFKIPPIDVPVFGGFKINASAGISFGQFFDSPQNYFVRDGIILAEDKSSFYPFINSFIHFYTQGSKNITVGGSVGVGFPLSNNNNFQSLTFFAGPSLIIGKEDRVIVNAGLMAGTVERLGQGYRLGETYVSEANVVPLTRRNELGFFAGVSYNFTSGK